MRELVFSVGITFLTGTLLFVYFRNKISNIDRKVNMVFQTIQEHNNRMQQEAQEEMKRFQMYHTEKMQENNDESELKIPQDENIENLTQSPTNLIDVSEQDSDYSDSGSDSDSEADDADDADDTDDADDADHADDAEFSSENKNSEVTSNDGIQEVIVDNKVEIIASAGEDHDTTNDGLQIMEEKLNIKSLEPLVNFNKYTKAQLRTICEEKGYTGWKSLNKGKLVTFLKNQ